MRKLVNDKTFNYFKDIKGVVQKLEQEIYVLEERLDRQRKQYNQVYNFTINLFITTSHVSYVTNKAGYA